MASRPSLSEKISLQDFTDHYWLKEELIHFCKKIGINSSGGKIEIVQRIQVFLSTGKIIDKVISKKTTSRFNWNSESLSLQTIITDNYKNTENVRTFFEKQIGSHFYFTTAFMEWMKKNVGKKLKEAILQWNKLYKLSKTTSSKKKKIAPQFQYNQYIKDFLENNSTLKIKDAIFCWNIKRSLPGSKKYEKNDLLLLKK
jgi:hypothetical protein